MINTRQGTLTDGEFIELLKADVETERKRHGVTKQKLAELRAILKDALTRIGDITGGGIVGGKEG